MHFAPDGADRDRDAVSLELRIDLHLRRASGMWYCSPCTAGNTVASFIDLSSHVEGELCVRLSLLWHKIGSERLPNYQGSFLAASKDSAIMQ